MAKQFKVAEDASYTCETAAHFWLLHVLARWEKFLMAVKEHGNKADSVAVRFLILGVVSSIPTFQFQR